MRNYYFLVYENGDTVHAVIAVSCSHVSEVECNSRFRC